MSVFAKMSVLSMNKQKLYSMKSNKLLKISAIAFLGACFCVPCIKVDKPSEYALTPRILTIDNLNLRAVNSSTYDVIVDSITYDQNADEYYLYFSVNPTALNLYQCNINHVISFTRDSGNQYHIDELYLRSFELDDNDFNAQIWYPQTGTTNPLKIQNTYFSDSHYVSSFLFYQWASTCEFEYSYGSTSLGASAINVWQETLNYTYNIFTNGFTIEALIDIDLMELVGGPSTTYKFGYQDGYQAGVQYVLDHLSNYNLYSQDQYLAYGSQQYALGLENAGETLSLGGLIHEIFKAPITMFQGIFNWSVTLPTGEVINVLPIMTFLLTIGIALAIVNLIMRIK